LGYNQEKKIGGGVKIGEKKLWVSNGNFFWPYTKKSLKIYFSLFLATILHQIGHLYGVFLIGDHYLLTR
jgi:hypothetical protein